MFEAGGQTLAFVLEGLGTKSIIARQVEEQLGDARASTASPTTRSRRSSTTSAASARCRSSSTPTSRPAPRTGTRDAARTRPARRLARGLRGRRRDVGRRRVAVAAGTGRRRRTSSWPAAPSASFRPGRAPMLGADLRRATRSCSSPASGLHANGSSLARAGRGAARRTATRRRCRAGARSARRCSTAAVDLRAAGRGRCSRARRGHYLSHITGHGLLKLMRPRARADLPDRRAAAEVPEVLAFLVDQAGMAATRRTARSTWAAGSPSTAAAGAGEPRSCGRRAGSARRPRGGRRRDRGRGGSCSSRSASCSRAATWT